MHEVSIGGTIRDYLTGEEMEETTYEEFRQALAKMLVEELGYPREQLRAKVDIPYEIEGKAHSRALDLVVLDAQEKPVMIIIFCSGKVGSFERETAIAARIMPGGPAPLAVATDTMTASLLNCRGDVLATGMQAIPQYDAMLELAASQDASVPTVEQRDKLTRIFHTYSGFLVNACCGEECKGPVKGPIKE